MPRTSSSLAALFALTIPQTACLADRLYDNGPLEGFNEEPAVLVDIDSARIDGSVGPEVGVADEAEISGDRWAGDGYDYINVTAVADRGDGRSVMSIVSLNQVPLEDGTHIEADDAGSVEGDDDTMVTVTGCSGGNEDEGYLYDAPAESTEVDVSPCGCGDSERADVTIRALFRDEQGRAQLATTTLFGVKRSASVVE